MENSQAKTELVKFWMIFRRLKQNLPVVVEPNDFETLSSNDAETSFIYLHWY